MPTAANILKVVTIPGEGAQAPAPGGAEFFASLLDAGAGTAETESIAGEEAAAPAEEQTGDPLTDLSALLPILDQQRLAQPAAFAPPTFASGGQSLAAEGGTPSPQGGSAPSVEAPAAPSNPDTSDKLAASLGAETKSAPIKGDGQDLSGKVPQNSHAGFETKAGTEAQAAAAPKGSQPAKAEAAASPAASQIQLAVAQAATATPGATGKPQGRTVARPDAPDVAQAPSQAAPAAVPQTGVPPVAPVEPRSEFQLLTEPKMELASSGERASSTTTSQTPLFQPGISSAPAPVQAQPQAAAAPLSQQLLDLARGGEWIDQLAREIAQTASGDGAMRFRLAPETLGELRVEITQGERGAHVKLHVASEAAQQALAEAQPKLVAEARAQGVRIAEAEISFGGGQAQERETARQQERQTEAQPRNPRSHQPQQAEAAASVATRPRTDRYA